jgi:precorrin-3B C17-methyltransferase
MSRLLYVVGIGPGGGADLTFRARDALESCDVIAGYAKYVELVKEAFPDKRFLTTGMRGEERRCEMAYEEAEKGKPSRWSAPATPESTAWRAFALKSGRGAAAA